MTVRYRIAVEAHSDGVRHVIQTDDDPYVLLGRGVNAPGLPVSAAALSHHFIAAAYVISFKAHVFSSLSYHRKTTTAFSVNSANADSWQHPRHYNTVQVQYNVSAGRLW